MIALNTKVARITPSQLLAINYLIQIDVDNQPIQIKTQNRIRSTNNLPHSYIICNIYTWVVGIIVSEYYIQVPNRVQDPLQWHNSYTEFLLVVEPLLKDTPEKSPSYI